jgi:phosphocarrier protein FPr
MVPCWLLDESRRSIESDPAATPKEERLVSLVLVSHSAKLVEGLGEMVGQVAGPDVRIETAGGTEDGRLGTSAPRIADAIRRALGTERPGSDQRPRATGVLVLLDLGSAALSLEIALEDLDEETRSIVRVSEAPLVEGAVLAAVQASTGASLDEVAAAAASAATMPKFAGN